MYTGYPHYPDQAVDPAQSRSAGRSFYIPRIVGCTGANQSFTDADENHSPVRNQECLRSEDTTGLGSVIELVVQYESDGADQQQRDAGHDELVGHHAPRHAGEHAAGGRDVVVGAVQRVARVRDGLPLPVQVLQDADAQLLRAAQTRSGAAAVAEQRKAVGSLPGVMGRQSRTAQAAEDALLFLLLLSLTNCSSCWLSYCCCCCCGD